MMHFQHSIMVGIMQILNSEEALLIDSIILTSPVIPSFWNTDNVKRTGRIEVYLMTNCDYHCWADTADELKMASIERIEEGDGMITVYFNSPYQVLWFQISSSTTFSDFWFSWVPHDPTRFTKVELDGGFSEDPPKLRPVYTSAGPCVVAK